MVAGRVTMTADVLRLPHRQTLLRRRPVVGVTGPDRGGTAAWLFTWLALALAGATARRITPRSPCPADQLDALVIGGGADVDPALYGEDFTPLLKPMPEGRRHWGLRILDLVTLPVAWLVRHFFARSSDERDDKARDALELSLLSGALERNLPVLGICRGAQLLNVHFGGSLHQDVGGFYVETRQVRTIRPRKHVRLTAGSHLATVLGRAHAWVNSLHRQAVNRLGRDLQVAAVETTGVVQAIEHQSLPFVVGVQWHPEFLPQRREQRALFRALVRASRRPVEPGGDS